MQSEEELLLDPSLVFYAPLWKRDGSLFISDDAYGHTCTCNVTFAPWGLQGRRMSGGGFVSVTSPILDAITGDMTLIAWVKRTTATEIASLFGKGDGNDHYQQYHVQIDAIGKVNFIIGNAANNGYFLLHTSGATLNNTTIFYHITCVLIGNTSYIYINGVPEVGKGTGSGTRATNTQPVFLGKRSTTIPIMFLYGIYSEGFIYNRGLLPLEITNNYELTRWRYQ